jgi:hypothetical protein
MAPVLIPCPHCECHARSTEATCPSCGEPLRRGDGSVGRSAVAVLLGLTATGALAGSCGGGFAPQADYGVAITTSGTGTGGAGGGDAGTGGSGNDGG